MISRKCANSPGCRNDALPGGKLCYSCELDKMEKEKQAQTDLHKWSADEILKREG